MILFEDLGSVSEEEVQDESKEQRGDDNGRVIELERELARIRHEYQGGLEELQSSNEELKSANEEIHSSNEELQSSNEELESSREELQSLNEELSTVNNELHAKTEELSRAYESITNVLDSTRIAILFLAKNLSIRRFTSEITRIFNLIDSDVGRPLDHISHRMEYNDFTQKVRRVLDTLRPFEDDVRTQDGHWYRMRIMVFRTGEKVIEGVVVTFINIDPQKQAQEEIERMSAREIEAQRRFAESIVDTVMESLLVLDDNYKVMTANRRFYETFGLGPEKVEGRTLFELGEGQWEIEGLRELLNEILSEGKSFEDYRVEHLFKTLGLKRMLLNARVLQEDGDNKAKILMAIEDVTGKQKDRG
jgi:two-component system CheB/CheR fusion protein